MNPSSSRVGSQPFLEKSRGASQARAAGLAIPQGLMDSGDEDRSSCAFRAGLVDAAREVDLLGARPLLQMRKS